MPASRASSTTYCRTGRSTIVSISFGVAFVAGRKRVPSPATGNTAFRTGFTKTQPFGSALRPRRLRCRQRSVQRSKGVGCGMSVLVTGGGGYIGSHMVWELVERGEKVVVLDDLSSGFDWAVAPAAQLVVGDIGDRVLLNRLMRTRGVETVMHFAGSVVVPESVADPLGYYLNNTVKSREIIAAAVANGVENFVFSSTAAIYGVPESVPVSEQAPVNPLSPYGASKAMTERMLADAGVAYGLRRATLRYFNVAGADPHGRTGQSTRGATHLLKVAVEAAT